MIGLLTDFGIRDPYVGQLHGVLVQQAPGVPVIDLWHHLPLRDVRAAAYLLPAYGRGLPPGSIYVCVVDPGVGGPRTPVALRLDGNWYVGPDNGLFAILWRRARDRKCFGIDWRPGTISNTFHGRDLFAPVAAQLARGENVPMHGTEPEVQHPDWPDDLAEILYIDHYGNAISGIRAASIPPGSGLRIADLVVSRAGTFSDVAAGEAFWYENSNGLVEIAVNLGSAAEQLALGTGDKVSVLTSGQE
ncbi:MAG: SAM-dependent chlorinase/fluorinase [Acidiferrobacteraceae bacterium]|jgi:S-adenosylmethionine hydrolase